MSTAPIEAVYTPAVRMTVTVDIGSADIPAVAAALKSLALAVEAPPTEPKSWKVETSFAKEGDKLTMAVAPAIEAIEPEASTSTLPIASAPAGDVLEYEPVETVETAAPLTLDQRTLALVGRCDMLAAKTGSVGTAAEALAMVGPLQDMLPDFAAYRVSIAKTSRKPRLTKVEIRAAGLIEDATAGAPEAPEAPAAPSHPSVRDLTGVMMALSERAAKANIAEAEWTVAARRVLSTFDAESTPEVADDKRAACMAALEALYPAPSSDAAALFGGPN